MTMLIATHEMGFAREVADEVCFLHDGVVLERGAPAAVLDSPREAETQRFLRRLSPTWIRRGPRRRHRGAAAHAVSVKRARARGA